MRGLAPDTSLVATNNVSIVSYSATEHPKHPIDSDFDRAESLKGTTTSQSILARWTYFKYQPICIYFN
jgi:hypothetical protein